jgi:outer membrane protein assembly factor BamB
MKYIKYFLQLILIVSYLTNAQDLNGAKFKKTKLNKAGDSLSYLAFDPYLNGVAPLSIRLEYQVTANHIKIGNSELSENSFRVFLDKPASIDAKLKSLPDFGNQKIVLATIPSALSNNGLLEIISDNGDSVWSYKYSNADEEVGLKVKKLLGSQFLKSNEDLQLMVAAIPVDEIAILAKPNLGSFRFCFRNESGIFFSKICSPPYRMSKSTGKIKVQNEDSLVRAYLNGKEVEAQGSVAANVTQSVGFFATSGNKYSIEFKVQPLPLNLIDYFQESDSKNIILTGHTYPPVSPNCKLLNPTDESSILYKIGWIPTIGDLKKYWTLTMKPTDTEVFLKGEGGGLFTYDIKFEKVPAENQRIMLDQNSLKSTYASELKIYGNAPPNVKISSNQKSVKIIKAETGRFVWNFEADQNGQEQTKKLILTNDQNNWLVTHTVYRGFNREVSFRLSGIVAQSLQLNTLSEFSYNQWFETLFGSESRDYSVQRWGFSFKNLQPLKTFKLKESTAEMSSVATTTADLKYRFTPGLWDRDESLGMILGYQKITFNAANANLLGTGVFWARSMPKIFDDLMNYLPFMSYPKWVDADITYYPLSLNNNVKLGSNFSMNFHGKVFWSKQIYGEAGGGFRAYEFRDLTAKRSVQLQAFYGEVGLGLNF